jgi:UDP-N-acetylmuramate dehydrogenase
MNLPSSLKQLDSVVRVQHQLAPYTYMKVGGPADYFTTVTNLDQLKAAVIAARNQKIKFFILGGGSNLIFADEGFRGLVIRNQANHISISQNSVITGSGALINALVNLTISQGLGGLEEFLGVPGTVGGAVYNNSHHLDHLIGSYIESVQALTLDNQTISLKQAACNFAYDHSRFQASGEIILSATFKLSPADKTRLSQAAQAALSRRRSTQPLELPSSGCMFKNIGENAAKKYQTPNLTTSAGYLIDQAGLKGTTIGGAIVSSKHANFIVNTGQATAKDIIDLSDKIISVIKDKYGVTLEREVFLISP